MCEEEILLDPYATLLPPPARTYFSLGNVKLGPTDTFSRSGEKKAPPPVEAIDLDGVVEKEPEVVEEEVAEIRRKAKEKWNIVKNLFLKKENPDEQKEDMCGIIVTALPAQEGGYSIKMENTNTMQRIVSAAKAKNLKKLSTKTAADFDFGDSDNLIIQDLDIPEIEVTGDLQCSVTLGPGQVLALKLVPKDEKTDVALGMSVAPGAKTETKELRSGCLLSTTTLSQCRGYDLAISNPSEKDIMYEFDFAASQNLTLKPHVDGSDASVTISGNCASILIPAGHEDLEFVSLRTSDRERPVRLHYNMSEPSAPTKETLKCGALLVTRPLKGCGGFLLSLQSQNPKQLALMFDFSQSKNLKPTGAKGVEVNGAKVRVVLPPKGMVDPFVTLNTDVAGQGILMKYALSHKEQ
eukprot:TRINITY_DN1362_c0_g1_i1.p1 TRINITY_DN1362_c0_g1~~TRINITY_DN1362_c0_g1_i1.p1  ORF type:complete len:409 (+),score=78.92 TRINITY_DN1362_c0_g1_i1:131-1357(+)